MPEKKSRLEMQIYGMATRLEVVSSGSSKGEEMKQMMEERGCKSCFQKRTSPKESSNEDNKKELNTMQKNKITQSEDGGEGEA